MKNPSFLLLILLFCGTVVSVSGQIVIAGKIFDDTTREPIPGVIVYLDGTSIHATTDANGAFTVRAPRRISTSLVMRHMAYETVTVADPFGKMPAQSYMTPKTHRIGEVVVVRAPLFTRKEMMDAFRRNFLGTTTAGQSCKIENEKDITLRFDTRKNVLVATAEQPIIVKNRYLGYTVHIDLKFCEFQYGKPSLERAGAMTIKTSRVYIDDRPGDPRYIRRRDEEYAYSKQGFLTHLANNTLEEARIEVMNGPVSGFPRIDCRDTLPNYFFLRDTLGAQIVHISPEVYKLRPSYRNEIVGDRLISVARFARFFNMQEVAYESRFSEDEISPFMHIVTVRHNLDPVVLSRVCFFMDHFDLLREDEGAGGRVFVTGHFAKLRMGDRLPLDYQPTGTYLAKFRSGE